MNLFDYVCIDINDGLKYLGYHIKPNDYKIKDWNWIIAKIERRINVWYNRWLSRAGRLILIKSVLEAILVYWMTLAWIPIGITNRIKCICRQFLWRNQGKASTFAWIAWDRINLPKQWGGWGIKDLHLFSRALAAKMGWHLISGQSLWK